jgi:ABC-2 type transport system ATP-binding protein
LDWKNKKIEELSKGMQQKVQFFSTILHKPEVLILDEPFTGLDPVNTEVIKQELFRQKKRGVTIIFSTHRMEQVEELCEYIFLINKGKRVIEGKVSEIKSTYKKGYYKVRLENDLPTLKGTKIKLIEDCGDGYYLIQDMGNLGGNKILRYMMKDSEVIHFEEVLPSLHEIFLETVKEKK